MSDEERAVLDEIEQAIQQMLKEHPVPERTEEYNGSTYQGGDGERVSRQTTYA